MHNSTWYKKRLQLYLLLLFHVCPISVFGQQKKVLFDNAHSEHPYRIPAIAATCSSGRLIAVCDYRPCGADIGYGRVDLKYRYSDDNGATWSPIATMAEGDGKAGSRTCGYGDPAIVADRECDDSVMVLCVTGNTVYFQANNLTGNPNRIARIYSSDGGRTWNRPVDITDHIYSLFDVGTHPLKSCFVGSGRIFQSRHVKVGCHYRLYAALCARDGGNRMIYSDDFGLSWHVLGGPDALPVKDGDEPKAEELPDGRVIISSRASGGRYFNVFTYTNAAKGEGTWETDATFSGVQTNGVLGSTNACNGETMIVPSVAWQKDVDVVLQSVPTGTDRKDVTIFYKFLQSPEDYAHCLQLCSNWDGSYRVSSTSSAYSTMTLQKDGRIAFFYEENAWENGYDMIYVPLDLSTIIHRKQ